LLTEYKNETNSVYGETTTTYHIQMSGQTVARRVIGTNIYGGSVTRTEWLHRNHLNQVVAVDSVNDSNQSVFGRIAGYSQPYNSGGPDQFQGHKDDPETSLHYNLARSYSPAMARWISADSITSRVSDPQSLNKYAYSRMDPINFIDPDGKEPLPDCAGSWTYYGFGQWACVLSWDFGWALEQRRFEKLRDWYSPRGSSISDACITLFENFLNDMRNGRTAIPSYTKDDGTNQQVLLLVLDKAIAKAKEGNITFVNNGFSNGYVVSTGHGRVGAFSDNGRIWWSQAAGDPSSAAGNATLAHEFFHQGQYALGQTGYTSITELEAAANSVRNAFFQWATKDPNTGQTLPVAKQKSCSP